MTRLIVFGCSLTYGDALPDCWEGDKRGTKPSKMAWPQLLADMTGFDCINMSKSGASNKSISVSVLNYEFKPSDIVIVSWTYASRQTIYRTLTDMEYINPGNVHTNKNSMVYYNYLHNDYNAMLETNMHMSHISNYLNMKGIVNIHAVPKADVDIFEQHTFNKTPIEDLGILDIGSDLALDNTHPGVESHIDYANELYYTVKDLCS